MKNQVVGDIFIVPNQVMRLGSFMTPEWYMERLRRLTGIQMNYGDNVIQVWVTSKTCDNWCDQYMGFQSCCGIEPEEEKERITRDHRLMGYFPKFFPVKLFENKKEGDILTLYCKELDITILLECNQLDHRYRKFGRFEEVYEKLVD